MKKRSYSGDLKKPRCVDFPVLATLLLACVQTTLADTPDDFVTTWQTDNPGISDANSITVPIIGGPYEVDWNNDGVSDETGLNGSVTHDFGSPGTYTIRIRGTYDSIRFLNTGDKDKILSLDQWGTNPWTTMLRAFQGASNLTVPATDTPDFSAVNSMWAMFAGAPLANPSTTGWNTAAVTTMKDMFSGAAAATPDTSGWVTSAVTSMSAMFQGAVLANPDTSGWDTSSVTLMDHMFSGAVAFDRDLGGWDVTALTDATGMLDGVSLSPANYESLLIGWGAQDLNPGVDFSGGNSTYCDPAASAARASMISTQFWSISDGGVYCSEDFVTTWKSDNLGPIGASCPYILRDRCIVIPIVGGPVDVDWNNDAIFDETGLIGPIEHEFFNQGTHTVRIRGTFDSISFSSTDENSKIVSVDQWGNNAWQTMEGAFEGAVELTVPATDTPNFSAVTSMARMFRNAALANPLTSGWDTSAVTDMASMFEGAAVATPDTGGWDTSLVTDMSRMFRDAAMANPDTSGWNTVLVTDMQSMFEYASLANPDTSGWLTPLVTNMSNMFRSAGSANPDTSGWDTAMVTDMSNMFFYAVMANPDTSGWDTSSVTTMRSLFGGASSADPDTSGWNVASVTTMQGMFAGATAADPDTSGWDTSAVTNMSTLFQGATSANPDTSGWDTSNVTDMRWMFFDAASANPDTSGWDTSKVTNMWGLFTRAISANPDTSGWITSAVTTMRNMFQGAVLANPDTSGWDISLVTTMEWMFAGALSANPDTSGWNTASVEFMTGMFQGAVAADPDTSGWDTSSVTRMDRMFEDAIIADPDTSGWNVSSVTTMGWMFAGATTANPNTSGWNTAAVSNMWGMFEGATSANPETSGWDTSSVYVMENMFAGATGFDRNLSPWDVSALTNAAGMFDGITLSTANYEALLLNWSTQDLNPGVVFSGGDSHYCDADAVAARQSMVNSDAWVITDGGPLCVDNFVTTWKTDNPGTSNSTSITVPMVGGPYEVDWGDDEIFEDTGLSGSVTHDFGAPGTYTIRIRGSFDGIVFNDGGDKEKILSLDQWGTTPWTVMNGAFQGAGNMAVTATDTPNVSAVTSMASVFEGAALANPEVDGWDTSGVSDMSWMFAGATAFDRNVGSWDVSALIDATGMLDGVTLSSANYDALLLGWDAQALQPEVNFSGGLSNYCSLAAAAARANMVAMDAWTISDGGPYCDPAFDFVTTWKTDNPGTSSSTSITVPIIGGPYEVDWDNDGLADEGGLTGAVTHDFGLAGNYTVRIRGNYDSLAFDGGDDKDKILSLDQWGNNAWKTMANAFRGAGNLVVPATDVPDFSGVSDLSGMFDGASMANPAVTGWDTSKVSDMSRMFAGASAFDRHVGGWAVSALTNATGMFEGITLSTANYEQLLVGWDAQELNTFVEFDGGGSHYCNFDAVVARENLADVYGWAITDGGLLCAPSDDFVTTWKTDNPSSGTSDCFHTFDNQCINVPIVGGPYSVDWNNDGVFDQSGLFDSVTHDFGTPGTYTIRIRGALDSISFLSDGDNEKILSVDQWGSNLWTTMEFAFYEAVNLTVPASDVPTLTAVSSLSYMFFRATSANPDTSGWNTSTISDMSGMFQGASVANPDVSGWDTSAVTDMSRMFASAYAFDRDIGMWHVSELTDASQMFSGVTLSTSNYESLLIGWNAQDLMPGVPFNGGNSNYCSAAAIASRDNMISSDGWTISDGGLQCPADIIFLHGFESEE